MGGEIVLRRMGPLCLIVPALVGGRTETSGRLLRLVKARARSIITSRSDGEEGFSAAV